MLGADQLGQQLLTELRARWLDALAAVAALHVNDNEYIVFEKNDTLCLIIGLRNADFMQSVHPWPRSGGGG